MALFLPPSLCNGLLGTGRGALCSRCCDNVARCVTLIPPLRDGASTHNTRNILIMNISVIRKMGNRKNMTMRSNR